MAHAGFLDPKTAGYWKGDHQNNHRHHRLSGLLLASLAIWGEVPEAAAYAGLALADCRQVAEALPPDGSNHEGPSYMGFGYSYVVRCFDALRHCSGIDLFAAPGLRRMPYFRAHLMTPGFHDVFNISDSGGGAYYFNHYLFRLAAEYRDPQAQALVRAMAAAEPGSFGYFPWPLLWYDAALEPASLEAVPRWNYFEDLEVAAYRTSWTDPEALAVLHKCGPYGGHRLNELRAENAWVNIAHDHPDANHVMLFSQGVMWLTDDGYPRRDKSGRHHNLVLVDGKGPLQRGGGWLQPIANMAAMGRLEAVTCEGGLFVSRGDASGYYPDLTTARRWVVVVDDRLLLLVDHLVAPQPRRLEALLHSSAGWRQTAPGRYLLEHQGRAMGLQIAWP
ncbi:MAG: heparinase II/III family protein, partial [Armatimonadetes bacterium]|nr:heparinase II/III family protein [Armatimonadota bacterium]